jgi:hypothetical protein
VKQILCEWSPDYRRMWPASPCFFTLLCLGELGERHSVLCLFIWWSY